MSLFGVIRMCFALVFGPEFVLGIGGQIGDPYGIYSSWRIGVFYRYFCDSAVSFCYGFILIAAECSVSFSFFCLAVIKLFSPKCSSFFFFFF